MHGRTLPVSKIAAAEIAATPAWRLSVPLGATHLRLKLHWSQASLRGIYASVSVRQTAGDGNPLTQCREIVGQCPDNRSVPVLIALSAGAKHINIEMRDAHADRAVPIERVESDFLISSSGQPVPSGAVGLIAADLDQVPSLLRDMADHYEHYRHSAMMFAADWGNWHSPETVVQRLAAASSAERQQPAGIRFDDPSPALPQKSTPLRSLRKIIWRD